MYSDTVNQFTLHTEVSFNIGNFECLMMRIYMYDEAVHCDIYHQVSNAYHTGQSSDNVKNHSKKNISEI